MSQVGLIQDGGSFDLLFCISSRHLKKEKKEKKVRFGF